MPQPRPHDQTDANHGLSDGLFVPAPRNPARDLPAGFPLSAAETDWDGTERRTKHRPTVPPMPREHPRTA